MTGEEQLQKILAQHALWCQGHAHGERADLVGANLQWANLQGATLEWANLRGAILERATLERANLQGANLQGANLQWANLVGANLERANLQGANLQWANLRGVTLERANLQGANLREANLRGVTLVGANLQDFQLPGGTLRVYGKKAGIIVVMDIGAEVARTACLINRKCRAAEALVIEVENDAQAVCVRNDYGETWYRVGEVVRPHAYDDDPRLDCAPGIHFFCTRAEAERWS